MRACAVIPVHDEARTIESVVRDALEHVKAVIIVDDGSSDGSAEAARRAGAIVAAWPVRRGKGTALRAGLALAFERGFDAAVTLDGDGQHLAREIPRLLAAAAAGADLVLGDRSLEFDSMPPLRRITNRFLTCAIRPLTGPGIRDSQCGFRLIRAALFRSLTLRSSHFEIETEMLVESLRRGARVAQVPVSACYAGERSKIRALPDTFRFARFLWRSARGSRLPAPAAERPRGESLLAKPGARCQGTAP